jgi:hypothetical protein
MDAAKLFSRIMRAKCEHLCPECGTKMTETNRVCENGIIFMWYRCSNNDCNGQWLQKTPRQPNVLGAAVSPVYAH